jgi:hypothetical protein
MKKKRGTELKIKRYKRKKNKNFISLFIQTMKMKLHNEFQVFSIEVVMLCLDVLIE